jgi:hypothetical protein
MLTTPRELPAEHQRPGLDRHCWPTQDRHPISSILRLEVFRSMWKRFVWFDWCSVLVESHRFFFASHRRSKWHWYSRNISFLDRNMGSDPGNWSTLRLYLFVRDYRGRSRRCLHRQSGRSYRSFPVRWQKPLMGEILWLYRTGIHLRCPDFCLL